MKKTYVVRGLFLLTAGIAISGFWYPIAIIPATALGLIAQAIQSE